MRVSISNGLWISLLICLLLCGPSFGGAAEWELIHDNGSAGFTASPARIGDTLYLSDDAGNVIALAVGEALPDLPILNPGENTENTGNTGNGVLWKTGLGSRAVGAPVVGRNGQLFVLTEGCKLFALDRNSGGKEWELLLEEDLCASAPAVSGINAVYLVSRAGRLIRVFNGVVSRTTDLSPGSPPGAAFVSSPSLGEDGTVYVADNRGGVHAVLDGQVQAVAQVGAAVASSPVPVDGGTLLTATVDGSLHALSMADLSPRWSVSGLGILAGPVVASDGRIHFITEGGTASVNSDGGGLTTPEDMQTDAFNSAPIVTTSGVWAVDRSGSLFRQSGNATTRAASPFSGGDEVYTNPVVGSDGTLHAATQSGKVYEASAAPLDTAAPWPAWGQYSHRRSGDWPKLNLSSGPVALSCNRDTASTEGTFSLGNGGPGTLGWTAQLVGTTGVISPSTGTLAPWGIVYPLVRIDEECAEQGDIEAEILVTDQFGNQRTQALHILKNPVCVSESRIDVLSCEPEAAFGITLSACLGRGYSYEITAPAWLTPSVAEGKLAGGEETQILFSVAEDEVILCNLEQVIRIVAKEGGAPAGSANEGNIVWDKRVRLSMEQAKCCSPVTKLAEFDGLPIAGIGARGDSVSLLGRDSNLIIEAGSGETLFEMDRFGWKVNYTELDWAEHLVGDGDGFEAAAFNYGTPLFLEDDLYIPCSDRFVRRYEVPSNEELRASGGNSTPEMKWEFDAEGIMFGAPAMGDGKLFVVTTDGVLSAIKNKNGKQKWEEELDELSSFEPQMVRPYLKGISSGSGGVSFDQGGTRHGAVSAVGSDGEEVVIVSSRARNIMAFDGESGKLLRYFPASAVMGTEPVVHRVSGGDHILFGTWDGYVGILSPDFDLLDKCDVGGPVSGKMIVDNGTIYVGNTDGVLNAVNILQEAGAEGTVLKLRKAWERSLVPETGTDAEKLWSIYPLIVDGPDLWVASTSVGEDVSARIARVDTLGGAVTNIIHDFKEGERLVGVPAIIEDRAFMATLGNPGDNGSVYQVDFQQAPPTFPIEYRVHPGTVICPDQDLTIHIRRKPGEAPLRLSAGRPGFELNPVDFATPSDGSWAWMRIPSEQLHWMNGWLQETQQLDIYADWTFRFENDENAVEITVKIQELCE